MERDRDNDKVEQLSQQKVVLEDRIDTRLEMLMDRMMPQQERTISKLELVSNELQVLQDTTVPTQKQIGDFRDQIRAELKTGERKNKNRLAQTTRKNSIVNLKNFQSLLLQFPILEF